MTNSTTDLHRQDPWLLVSGGFHRRGGMDKANLVLAEYLLEQGRVVHLVCHFVEPEIEAHPRAVIHKVARPLQSYFLGSFLLDYTARGVARRLRHESPEVQIVVNGGNCPLDAINWSHFVHAAWKAPAARTLFSLRRAIEGVIECRRERHAYRKARLIITNSDLTAAHIRDSLNNATPPMETIYLGGEQSAGPVTELERRQARQEFGIPPDRKMALFVGGLGFDGRKGFDILFGAWQQLSAEAGWDVDLWAAGEGPAFDFWNAEVRRLGLQNRIRMLGFRQDVSRLLASADVLVSPSRYEPYGLNVQEAICRGVAAIASAGTGIAERFPEELRPLLLPANGTPEECAACLRIWRRNPSDWQTLALRFGAELRSRSWAAMAREMVDRIENTAEQVPDESVDLVAR